MLTRSQFINLHYYTPQVNNFWRIAPFSHGCLSIFILNFFFSIFFFFLSRLPSAMRLPLVSPDLRGSCYYQLTTTLYVYIYISVRVSWFRFTTSPVSTRQLGSHAAVYPLLRGSTIALESKMWLKNNWSQLYWIACNMTLRKNIGWINQKTQCHTFKDAVYPLLRKIDNLFGVKNVIEKRLITDVWNRMQYCTEE